MSLNAPELSGVAGAVAIQRKVTIVDSDYTMTFEDDVVIATTEGTTIQTPPGVPAVPFGPNPAAELRICAEGGGCFVQGNGFPINGSTDPLPVSPFGAVTLNWDEENQTWIGDGGGTNTSGAVSQPTWFINFATGSNANTGKTSGQALKTFQNWQSRVEDDDLSPTGGIFTMNIIGDLGPNDEITWRNSFAQGCTGIVNGSKKILAQGNITGFVARQTAPNEPYTVIAPQAWAGFVGKLLLFTNGPAAGMYAWIGKELVPGTQAALSEFVQDPGGGILAGSGIPQPAFALPVAGNHYQILDFSAVQIGNMRVGADNSGAIIPFQGNGLLLNQLHVGGTEFAWPLLSGDAFFGLYNCIIDAACQISAVSEPFIQSSGNCNFSCGLSSYFQYLDVGGCLTLYAGIFLQNTSVQISPLGNVLGILQPQMYVGTNGIGNGGGYQVEGSLQLGPCSFFDAAPGGQAVLNRTGALTDFTGFFMEADTPPIWGTLGGPGPNAVINCLRNSRLHMNQPNNGGAFTPPTITNVIFPNNNPIIWDDQNQGGINVPANDLSDTAAAIDPLTQVPAPGPVLRVLSWANLFSLIGAGGFGYSFVDNINGGATKLTSGAVRGDLGCSVTVGATHL